MRAFAILHEPAQYTTDRNHAVYDKLGVRYAYMYGQSEARSDEGPAETPLSELTWWQLTTWLWRLLRDNDIIIMNGYNNGMFLLLFLLNKLFGRAIGLDSDTPLSVPHNSLKRITKRLYLHTIFTNRHIYGLAGGTGSHKELFRHYGMREERIFLMPMMVDNGKFYVTEEKPVKPYVYLYVGRIVECKNLPVMIEAFIQTFAGRDDVQMQIVGGGELLEDYQRLYAEHKNILFLGKQFGKELVKTYHSSHVFVLPSSFEPWGLVVNEAMAAGLPVIVSDHVGAAHDLVEGHETGFIFPYNDTEELAQRMKELQEDKALYKRFSENAYHRMHDVWNYNLYTKCLQSFIDHVAQK